MILRIDTTSSVPVYAQIVDQVKRAIASGVLRPGDLLPSLRETSINLRVNPLTVGKAYKLLEQEKLIETRHGLGSFVTASALTSANDYRREVLAQALDSVLVDAFQLGIKFDDIRKLLDERIEAAGNSFAQDKTNGGNRND